MCTCSNVAKSPLWTPVPEYRQATEMAAGENMDCAAVRSGSVSGLKNDIGPKNPDRIDNVSMTSDLNGVVSETFILTPGSTRTATAWAISVNGNSGVAPLTELAFNTTTGGISGTVSAANLNKNYQVMITASDAQGQIDSRSYNFFPKTGSDAVKFIFPLSGTTRISCGFGPRTPPVPGASSFHNGIDIARTDHSAGDILAAADGVVVKAGPATGFGHWIILNHNNSQGQLVASTVYGHMYASGVLVSVGDKVSAGQKIGIEGGDGLSAGKHLHFEIHKGGYKHPVDPVPYLSGSLTVATNNTGTIDPTTGISTPSGSTNTVTNGNVGMTHAEATSVAPCPPKIPNTSTAGPGEPEVAAVPSKNNGGNTSACAPPAGQIPSSSDVIAAITAACQAGGLGSYDTQFLINVATIESSLNPYAKCPTSSATGLFQMLDKTATAAFSLIGEPPTCANRCDMNKASQAMVAFYKQKMLPYWTNFVASGKTTLAGKAIQPTSFSGSGSPYYANLSQGCWVYGLIHHDGVGNAVKGIDKGGVSYWKSKVGSS